MRINFCIAIRKMKRGRRLKLTRFAEEFAVESRCGCGKVAPPQTDSFCRGVCISLLKQELLPLFRLKQTRIAEEFAGNAPICSCPESPRLKLTRIAEEFAITCPGCAGCSHSASN